MSTCAGRCPGRSTARAWSIRCSAATGCPPRRICRAGVSTSTKSSGTAFGSKPDLDKAKSFLQKAGGPPPRPLTIVVQNLPDLADCVTILQQNLKALGLESTIQAQEPAGFLPKLTGNDGYDLLIIRGPVPQADGYGPDYPYLGMISTSPTNFNHFNDPKMDDLTQEGGRRG